jgi:PleD family two-component response regulator
MAYANSTQREQLRTQALTDELTGLFNRRHFEHSLVHRAPGRARPRRSDIGRVLRRGRLQGHQRQERLVREADEHLRRAKREGRDRVVLG